MRSRRVVVSSTGHASLDQGALVPAGSLGPRHDPAGGAPDRAGQSCRSRARRRRKNRWKIDSVNTEQIGAVNELHVRDGGLFGFGSKTIVVPGDKIAQTGSTIQLSV